MYCVVLSLSKKLWGSSNKQENQKHTQKWYNANIRRAGGVEGGVRVEV